MCGLAGLARTDGGALSPDADGLLRRMAHAVTHRGPDERELLRSGPVGLAFTRLSLVDPAAGSQPLHSPDGSVVLIANGEVYNHRELAAALPAGSRPRTGSDCEVLVHLYQHKGLGFLDDVRGMFSIVLWDRKLNRLVLARDRFGVKPLFFHRNRERIVFGSEMKALFEDPACPRELDWDGALTDQAINGALEFSEGMQKTWFRGIETVPPGTIRTVDLDDGSISDHVYWSFPNAGEYRDDLSAEEFIEEYAGLLSASVAECETSDAELGLFLSGGVDSAAIAALSTVRPRTFTALNGSTLANRDAEYGHRAAELLGLANHQVLFDTAQVPSAEEWKSLLWLLESPQCGPEIYYKRELYRFVKARFPEIKGMLLGGGADEFNGGYSVSMSSDGGWEQFMANIGGMALRDHLHRNRGAAAWWDQSALPLIRAEVLRGGAPPEDPYERFLRWKYRDVQQYNCWHEDRTAAGSGIEARVPFLDHRLVELSVRVPPALRERLIWDKRILRDGLDGVLPQEFIHRPKVPFFYGDGVHHTYRTFAAMLAADGDALLDEALSGPRAKEYIDADNARATLRALQDDPSSGHVEFLLRVVNLGLLEQMAGQPPRPPVEATWGPVPTELPVSDWESESAAVEARVLLHPQLHDALVPAFDDSVLLLSDRRDPLVRYVIVDGEIEYVIDGEETPAWQRLLDAVDGQRGLGELLAAAGCAIADVEEPLLQSVEFGVLTLAEPASAG
ncbi:asparagine synthase (glutamine-hydrolyzing) [Streptomyces regalis]|uniref:asparagine synthase (glutamine-hydrolyzing) n=1 Tax=Streptomyces regalis TaxID=68262 RepID=A0A117MJU1_9ACTN|nr:asparagine synthase (glutamine-hydrolyzing) [Streptomyces regalis]KUL21339.1 asparagine synthase [Streptomyces regalis]